MNSVMETKLNMAENEVKHSENNTEIGDQNTEPLETKIQLEKCNSQPDLCTETSKSKSLTTTPIIKCTLRTTSITHLHSENRAAKLVATTRLTTPTLRPPSISSGKPMLRKNSTLSNISGVTSTNSTSRSVGNNVRSVVKRNTPTTSKTCSRESLKPKSTMKKPIIKFDNLTTKTIKSTTTTSRIPVNKIRDSIKKPETESMEFKQMERRINTVTNTCIKIVNKTHDNDSVLEIIKSIDLNDCVVEKLKLLTQLFDICCKEHKDHIEQSNLLKKENNELRTQVNDFSVKIQEFRQNQKDAEIMARDNTISELKLQLEDSIFEYNSLKVESKDMTELLEQQEQQLKKYQEDINHMEAKIAELQNKLNICNTSYQTNEELQDQIEDLEKKLNEKSAEYADTLHKAQQFFSEMMGLKDQIKEISEERQNLEKKVEKLSQHLFEYENIMSEEQIRETTCARKIEISHLKIELHKALRNIQNLKEENSRLQQLLDLKTELKNSLEETEIKQEENLLEFKGQVEEKTNVINNLTEEVNNKSIDCEKLFNNLSHKQLLISQQEHEIRMLREGNHRSQFLRLKQEEKIARLEDKIHGLQQIIMSAKECSISGSDTQIQNNSSRNYSN